MEEGTPPRCNEDVWTGVRDKCKKWAEKKTTAAGGPKEGRGKVGARCWKTKFEASSQKKYASRGSRGRRKVKGDGQKKRWGTRNVHVLLFSRPRREKKGNVERD